jgi:hypothetical protein
MFRVIYLWRGERHVLLRQPETEAEAMELVRVMRADKWQAWFEVVQ